ncbi:MAG: hypothetical protein MUC38_11125, partial [Cyclobacteriaceae bacterium]|nr:hypothetical protein [Cyclobacteriaceae bacterium]
MSRFFSVVVGFLFFAAGLAGFLFVCVDTADWVARTHAWPRAVATLDDIEGTPDSTVLLLTVHERDGSTRQIRKPFRIDAEDEDYYLIGNTFAVTYPAAKPADVHFDTYTWWGVLLTLAFLSVFMAVGILYMSSKAQNRFHAWNHDWRFWWGMLVFVGLLAFVMAVVAPEPSDQSWLQSKWAIR